MSEEKREGRKAELTAKSYDDYMSMVVSTVLSASHSYIEIYEQKREMTPKYY